MVGLRGLYSSTVSGSQPSKVQSAAGGRKKLSVVPHRKQLYVSRFTQDTTSEDVLEFIREKFPSENISIEQSILLLKYLLRLMCLRYYFLKAFGLMMIW